MTGTEEFHLNRCVGFAELNWEDMGMDGQQAVKIVEVVTDVRTRVVVEDSCFAQRVRMYQRVGEPSPGDFETASLRLSAPWKSWDPEVLEKKCLIRRLWPSQPTTVLKSKL